MLNQEKIKQNLDEIFYNINQQTSKLSKSSDDVAVMAVTKTVDTDVVNLALASGIKLLGENRVQEFLDKKDSYNVKKDAIHFIGYLQTNKVKYIIENVSMIESVHSVKLAQVIDNACAKKQLKMDVLLEVNIGQELSKSGFRAEDVCSSIEQIAQLENIHIKGLMCIPPRENTEYYFAKMQQLYNEINIKGQASMQYLSMGMSNDYEMAIKYGSNIIRLGSAIFGKRNYTEVNNYGYNG